jgi:hypothetical protein
MEKTESKLGFGLPISGDTVTLKFKFLLAMMVHTSDPS